MVDLELTPEEIALLFGDRAPKDGGALSTLLGEPNHSGADVAGESSSSQAVAEQPRGLSPSVQAVPGGRPSDTKEERFAWLEALHLVPGYEALARRYPPISERRHPKHGRVIVAAYLEDTARRVRRNFKLGEHLFFDAPELDAIEPDTKSVNCRIAIKVIRYEVGMRIRFWENRPGGDAPGKSGSITVTEAGLKVVRFTLGRG